MSKTRRFVSRKSWLKQLRELPAKSVVLDRNGDAWQSAYSFFWLSGNIPTGYWYRSYGDDSEVTDSDLASMGPFRVLWKGGPNE